MKSKQEAIDIRTIELHKPPDTATSVLSVVVPYTTQELTEAALKHAGELGAALGAEIRLIDVHVVPFACPINEPTVSKEYLVRRLGLLAEQCPLPVRPELMYSRDREHTLEKFLKPHSLVVIAVKRLRWPGAEKKLARFLMKAGHDVVLLAVR